MEKYYWERSNGQVSSGDVRVAVQCVFDKVQNAVETSNGSSRGDALSRGAIVTAALDHLPRALADRVRQKLGFAGATSVPATFSFLDLTTTTLTCVDEMLKELNTNAEIGKALVVPKAVKSEGTEGKDGKSGTGGGRSGSDRSGKGSGSGGGSSGGEKKTVSIVPPSSSTVTPTASASGCFNCGSTAHVVANCDKKCKYDSRASGCKMGTACSLARTHTRKPGGSN